MYKIIGADQKQYGPISEDQIRQWIAEGRVNGQTQVCAEGSEDWKPLSAFPEFGFTDSSATTSPAAQTAVPVTPEEILARDYSLDIGGCISRAWSLFKENFATVFVTFLLFFVLFIAAGIGVQVILAVIGINRLPTITRTYLNPIFFMLSSIVMGPVGGGLYQVYLSVIRKQPTSASELFNGFKMFHDLFLGKFVPGLIISLCMLPANIVYAYKAGMFLDHLQQDPHSVNPQDILPHMLSDFGAAAPAFAICMLPVMYFSTNWLFTLALIIDKKMGFWTAMTVSWKMVHRHWLHVFGLVVLVGLINLAGCCMCCVGALVTVPIGLAALMYAYEDIFSRKTA